VGGDHGWERSERSVGVDAVRARPVAVGTLSAALEVAEEAGHAELADGRRHVHEAQLKEVSRTPGRHGHEALPPEIG